MGRLRPPRDVPRRRLEHRPVQGTLGSGHFVGPVGGKIAGEDPRECVRFDGKEAVIVRMDGSGAFRFGQGLQQFAQGLAAIRRDGRDIDQGRDALVDAGLPDDDAAPGMTDQHGRPLEAIEGAPCGGDIVRERRQRRLHRRHRHAAIGQDAAHPLPAAGVDERPVDKHDVAGLRGGVRRRNGRRHGDECGDCRCDLSEPLHLEFSLSVERGSRRRRRRIPTNGIRRPRLARCALTAGRAAGDADRVPALDREDADKGAAAP